MAKFHNSSQLEKNDRFVISFDLTKEIIIPIQLPDHRSDDELYLCYLGNNQIALFVTSEVYIGTDSWYRFRVWGLNEHCSSNSSSIRVENDEEPWTELGYFRIKHGLPGEWIIPRGISNDGVFVLLETGIPGLGNKKKMKLCNLITGQVNNSFIYCNQVPFKAYAYKPSLVSIIGGNGRSSSYTDRVIGNDAAAESASQ